jgi:phosphatidylserine/phosphatidylglycerophosphate/cardiolipin synthase-like enzyme
MNAKETQKMAFFLIVSAVKKLLVTCFTYDLTEMTSALVAAAKRGVQVTVVADKRHTLLGATAKQVERFQAMLSNGITVLLSEGIPIQPEYAAAQRQVRPATGIQHSKVLMSDEYMIVGSVNWTTSSSCNQELSALTRLRNDGQAAAQRWFGLLTMHAEPLTPATAEKAEAVRIERRSRSSGRNVVVDRHRTAKRFSIARSKSADALVDELRQLEPQPGEPSL